MNFIQICTRKYGNGDGIDIEKCLYTNGMYRRKKYYIRNYSDLILMFFYYKVLNKINKFKTINTNSVTELTSLLQETQKKILREFQLESILD